MQQIINQAGTIDGPYPERITCFELHACRFQVEGVVAGFFFRSGLIQLLFEQEP
ncbi:hypothetical protein D3C73_835380 [compost metagenome]